AAHPHPLETEEGDTIVTPHPVLEQRDHGTRVVSSPAPIDVAPTPLGVVLTVDQAAARMNMSVRYVRRLVADRRIAFHRVGRSIRLIAADVDAHVAAGRVEPLTTSEVWRNLRSVG
ncbi:excisionase family DNA-binding protein, partial [Candidatus Frankia nodulisporulans]